MDVQTDIETEAGRPAARRAAGAAKRVEAQAAAAERREIAAAEARQKQSADLRAALRKAIAERADADRAAATSREILNRAATMIRTAEADVARYSSLAGKIAEHHAEAIAASVLEGRAAPGLTLSPELVQQKQEAREAQERLDKAREQLEAARAAQGALVNGRTSAEERAYRAGVAVSKAVAAVLSDEAELMAEELIEEQAALWARLDAISGFMRAARPQPGIITPSVSPRLAEIAPQLSDRRAFIATTDQGAKDPSRWPWLLAAFHEKAEAGWRDLSRRLTADADAKLSGEEPSK
jgi:hypothetical protein